jgi:hypothetical protein
MPEMQVMSAIEPLQPVLEDMEDGVVDKNVEEKKDAVGEVDGLPNDSGILQLTDANENDEPNIQRRQLNRMGSIASVESFDIRSEKDDASVQSGNMESRNASQPTNARPPLAPLKLSSRVFKSSTEKVGLVYAQMLGQMVIDTNYIRETLLAPLTQKAMYKAPGASSQGFAYAGGGSLGVATLDRKESNRPCNNN